MENNDHANYYKVVSNVDGITGRETVTCFPKFSRQGKT